MYIFLPFSCEVVDAMVCVRISDYDEQLSHAVIIQAHYVFLLETLDVKFSGLVGLLLSKQVISAEEAEDIGAEVTCTKANEKLLSVLSRKSPRQFQLFLDALDDCAQQHVRCAIAGPCRGCLMYFVHKHARE